MNAAQSLQLGFDALIADAEKTNEERRFERETGHLPSTMADAVPYYRLLLKQHHAAMLAADIEGAMALRDEAHKLALRLNGGEPGILAHDDAPGHALQRATNAATGELPHWGQTGEFPVSLGGILMNVELEGMFGIGAGFSYWPGFAVRAIAHDRPFISSTGYRSFLGVHAEPVPGLMPDEFVAKVVGSYLERELRGRPVAIEERYQSP
jgi:hypothetical protein